MNMNKDITRYLNDHLAGASAALTVIQELADKYERRGLCHHGNRRQLQCVSGVTRGCRKVVL